MGLVLGLEEAKKQYAAQKGSSTNSNASPADTVSMGLKSAQAKYDSDASQKKASEYKAEREANTQTPTAATIAEQITARLKAATEKYNAAKQASDDYSKSHEGRLTQKIGIGTDEKRLGYQETITAAAREKTAAENEKNVINYAAKAQRFTNNTAVKSKADKARETVLPEMFRLKEGDAAWQNDKYNTLNADELEIYNRLAKNGQEADAERFVDALETNRRVTLDRLDAAKGRASGLAGGIGASVGSVLLNGIMGVPTALGTAANKALGKEFDEFAPMYYGSRLSSTMRGTVAENIESHFGNLSEEGETENNGKIASFLYQTGMSMADMAMAIPTGKAGMQIIMSSNAGVSSMLDAKDRGATDGQALWVGVTSGAAEAIFERFSIENLLSGKVSTSAAKAALKQAGIEASEEMATEIANIIADILIMTDQSAYNTSVESYMETEHLTRTQAEARTFGDNILQVLLAGAGGALSGGIMGGAGDYINASAQGRALVNDYADTLLEDESIQDKYRRTGLPESRNAEQSKYTATEQAKAFYQTETQSAGTEAPEKSAAYRLSQKNTETDKMGYAAIGRQYTANKAQAYNEAKAEILKSDNGTSIIKALDKAVNESVQPTRSELLMIAQNDTAREAYNSMVENGRTLSLDTDGTVRVTRGTDADGAVLSSGKATFSSEGLKNVVQATVEESSTMEATDLLRDGNILYTRENKDIRDLLPKQRQVLKEGGSANVSANRVLPSVEHVNSTEQYSAELSEITPHKNDDLNTQIDALQARLDNFPYRGSKAALRVQGRILDLQEQLAAPDTTSARTDLDAAKRSNARNAIRTPEDALNGYNLRKSTAPTEETIEKGSITDYIGGNEPVPEDAKVDNTQRKRLHRTFDKVKKSSKLDERAKGWIEKLVKDGLPLERVASALYDNDPTEVTDYYNAYKAVRDAETGAVKYRKEVLKRRHKIISDAINNNLWRWKDKATGFQYSRSTQERNIRDIADPETAQWVIDNIFNPAHRNEAQKMRWKNEYSERARAYKLTKTENELVHILITERDLKQRLENPPKGERKKIESALDETMRRKAELMGEDTTLDEERCNAVADDVLSIYREIYDKLVDVQIKNGMPVTELRSTYAPAVKDKKGKTVLTYIGIELENQELPASLAGLTEMFKPGKPWFSHDLARTGYRTAFDTLGGLDEYLETAGNVIYHTDDIQNVRMLETVIREHATDETKAEKIQELVDSGLTGDELWEQIRNAAGVDSSHLARYVQNLQEHGNLLAGKKSKLDRTFEYMLGRRIYKTVSNLRSRITSNVIGGNMSVVLSQLIPLTQATGVVSYQNLLKGVSEAARAYAQDDGFNGRSTFVTNRMGYKQVGFKDGVKKVADAVAKPFEIVDEVVASAIVRGRYYDNIANGMSETDAMRNADDIAASLIADRSRGALPTVFGSNNPVSLLLTAFQIESNNQLDFMFKDLKMDADKKTTGNASAAVALALAKMFIAAFAYNELRKKAGLTDNAFDPIGWMLNVINEVSAASKGDQTISETVENIKDETIDQIPFIGGGRYGSIYENAMPDAGNIIRALENVQEDGTGRKYFWQTVGEEAVKPVLYLGMPVGGAQVKKTIQGAKAIIEGGSYKYDKNDEKRTQYIVPNQTTGQILARTPFALMFGKSALPEAKEWRDNGFPTYSLEGAAAVKDFKASGGDLVSFKNFEKQYDDLSKQISKDNMQISELQEQILDANPIYSGTEARAMAEERLGKKMRSAANEWLKMLAEDGSLTEEQKIAMIGAADISKESYDSIKGVADSGVSIDKYLDYSIIADDLGDEYGVDGYGSLYSEGKKAMQRLLIDDDELTPDAKEIISRKLIDKEYIFDYSSKASAEIALMGKTAYKKYDAAKNECGITAERYLEVQTKTEDGSFKGSDSNGKTVYYLKQARLANYVDALNESEVVKKYIWDSIYSGDDDCEYENRHRKLVQKDGIWQTSGGMY